jgi:hypothetical protein
MATIEMRPFWAGNRISPRSRAVPRNCRKNSVNIEVRAIVTAHPACCSICSVWP